MEVIPAKARRGLHIAITLLFMVSGATSLVYETIWARQLHLVFGTSQLAISTLLAAFMAGLALGGWLGGRWAHTIKRPLLAYAALEAFIAAYAIAFPLFLQAAEPLYIGFWRAFEPSPLVFGVFQFVLVGLLLLPPTCCMGATLPLLATLAARFDDRTGRTIGRLYGANTLGAVAGIAISGFVLLPQLGLRATTLCAVAANALLALAAASLTKAMSWDQVRAEQNREAPKPLDRDAPPLVILAILAAIAGFTSLVYEVAWFRLMALMLGGSAYAFSIMLLAFLLGIALGGWAGGGLADRSFARGRITRTLACLALLEAGVGVAAWMAMFAYGEMPFAYVSLYNSLAETPTLLWLGRLFLALALMLPPALLMGAAFPCLVRAAAGPSPVSRAVGFVYAANTAGAVLGAFIGGFLLLPALHVHGTVLAAITLNIAASILAYGPAILADHQRRTARLGRCIASGAVAIAIVHVFSPSWNPLLMTCGIYQEVEFLPERSRAGLLSHTRLRSTLLFYDEGLSSVVTVGRDPYQSNIWLANNGKVDASIKVDLCTQVMLGHLPFMFRTDAQRVLVIGLASGISAGCVTLHQQPKQIDIAEIEPAIVTASHFFDDYNYRPLDDPRVSVVLNDARNHLNLAADGTYDLVTSEPSNPWLTGVSNLFTREFFELGKRKLAPNGIWAQWVQCYSLSPDDLRSLLATFATVYEHVRLFYSDDGNLIVLGSGAPLPLDASDTVRIFSANHKLDQSLRSIDINTPDELLSFYIMDRPQLMQWAGDIDLNTDDNMRIEYSAPLQLQSETASENYQLLLSAADVPLEAVHTLDQLGSLGKAYLLRRDRRRAELVWRQLRSQDANHPAVALMTVLLQQLSAAEQRNAPQ
ncbi:MAG: fused MFS/spermidine synthase [Phycisphaerales bacterium]|nr:fused MFS/spermidine synthase [Phycisphaerales bacterium]